MSRELLARLEAVELKLRLTGATLETLYPKFKTFLSPQEARAVEQAINKIKE